MSILDEPVDAFAREMVETTIRPLIQMCCEQQEEIDSLKKQLDALEQRLFEKEFNDENA